MSQAELILVNITEFLAANIETYIDDHRLPDTSFLTGDEYHQLIRIKNAACLHGFRAERGDTGALQYVPKRPAEPTGRRCTVRQNRTFSRGDREVCAPVVTFKDAEQRRIQLIKAAFEDKSTLCSLEDRGEKEEPCGKGHVSIIINFSDESSFVINGLGIPLTEQDLDAILQDMSALDASDTMFRPKTSVRARVVVRYESSEGTRQFEYSLTNSHRLCLFIRSIGKSSNSLNYAQRFDEQSKALLREKVIAFITSNAIVCSSDEITSRNDCSSSMSELASRVAALIKVYPHYPDTLVKILRRFKSFVETVEKERIQQRTDEVVYNDKLQIMLRGNFSSPYMEPCTNVIGRFPADLGRIPKGLHRKIAQPSIQNEFLHALPRDEFHISASVPVPSTAADCRPSQSIWGTPVEDAVLKFNDCQKSIINQDRHANIFETCQNFLGDYIFLNKLMRFEERNERSNLELSSKLQFKMRQIIEEIKIKSPTPYCSLLGCTKLALVVCPICNATRYCSVEHQDIHATTHDPICRDFIRRLQKVMKKQTRKQKRQVIPKKICDCKHKACLTYCLYFGKPKDQCVEIS